MGQKRNEITWYLSISNRIQLWCVFPGSSSLLYESPALSSDVSPNYLLSNLYRALWHMLQEAALTQKPRLGKLEGSGWVPGTIDPVTGHRSSSQTSFLAEAMRQTSIKVYTRTMATKVVFNDQRAARGVQVETAGKSFFLEADKEVILSAGAFQSPQLLMFVVSPPKRRPLLRKIQDLWHWTSRASAESWN